VRQFSFNQLTYTQTDKQKLVRSKSTGSIKQGRTKQPRDNSEASDSLLNISERTDEDKMSVDTDSSVDSDTNSSDTNISDNQLHNISRRKIRECLSEKICQQHSEKIRENFASVSLLSSCEASEDGSSSSSELSDFWDSDQEEDVTPHFVRFSFDDYPDTVFTPDSGDLNGAEWTAEYMDTTKQITDCSTISGEDVNIGCCCINKSRL